jgi:putative endonuclease
MNWQVYIVLCTDDSLYTGISTDVERRLRQHDGQRRGARYFRGRRPERLVYLESGHTRSSASRREAAIKKLNRLQKCRLIASAMNDIAASERRLRATAAGPAAATVV